VTVTAAVPMVTRQALIDRARLLSEELATVSVWAWDDARAQAGLPDIFIWSNLTPNQARNFAFACQIRLLELCS